MKKIFEKLFCKHEWELLNEDKSYYFEYTDRKEYLKELHRVYACKHCGKIFVDDKKFY